MSDYSDYMKLVIKQRLVKLVIVIVILIVLILIMKTGLYLDDYRTPKENKEVNWNIVRTYNQFIDYINANGLPDVISFDHDLAEEHMLAFFANVGKDLRQVIYDYDNFVEKTGLHAAKWLCNYCVDNNKKLPKLVTVHSANFAGAENILSVLRTFNKVTGGNSNIYKTIW